MAAFTESFVAPKQGWSRRIQQQFFLLILAIGASASVQAQISCPMIVDPMFGGDNQTTVSGSGFPNPLMVSEAGMASAPSPFDVTWTVVNPPSGVTILQSMSSTLTAPANITGTGPFNYESSVDIFVDGSYSGPIQVVASTPFCTSQDSTFTLTAAAPLSPMVDAFSGSGQSTLSGEQFPQPLGVTVSQGGATPGPVVNALTTFTITSGPAEFPGGLSTVDVYTDPSGMAFVPLFASTGVTVATAVSVSVSALGTSDTYTALMVTAPGGMATVTPTPPTSTPLEGMAGQVFLQSFQLALLDAAGMPPLGVPVTFTLSAGSPGAFLLFDGTPSGNTLMRSTGPGGTTAPIQVHAGTAGSFTLTATAAGYPTTVWNLMAVGSGGGLEELVIVDGNAQTGRPGARFPNTLDVQALVGGTPTDGVFVQYTIVSGDAYFDSPGDAHVNGTPPTYTFTSAITGGPQSLASVPIFAGSGVGPVNVLVEAGTFAPVSFTLTVEKVLEPVIIESGDAQQAEVNSELAQPLVAGVTPEALVDSPNGQLLFEVQSGTATFVESGTSTFSAVPSGPGLNAQARLRLGNQSGPVQISVSFPGMITSSFTATALEAVNGIALIKTQGDGQRATTDLLSAPLAIKLSQAGTAIGGASIDWAVTSGDATLESSSTTTSGSGDASATLRIGSSPSSISVRVRASVNGDPVATTDFVLSSDHATLTTVAGSGQSGAIGSNADEVFSFELRRADGSVLPGQVVQFSATGGSLTATSATTGSDGRVSVGLRYGPESQSVSVTASAFANTITANGSASTFVPQISSGGGNNQSAAAGSQLPQPLVVQISQPPAALHSKGLQGVPVVWTVLSGGGQLGNATTTTDTSGRSSNTLRLGSTLGAQQVRAVIAGVGEIIFDANATVPENSVLEIVSGNGQRVVPQRPSEPLVVRLRSAAGAGIGGFVVRFTPSEGASVDPGEVTTNQDGRASTVGSITLPGEYTITASVPNLSSITPVVFNLGNGIANLPQLDDQGNRVAQAIDRACPALARATNLSPAELDLLQRCSELVINSNINSGDVVTALDKLLADESSAQNNAALASASAQFENLKGRFAALRSGSTGLNLGGLALATSSGRLPLSFLPSNLLLKANDDESTAVAESFSRWGFFATGTIGRGSRDPGDTDPGGEFDNYGLTAGIDYRITDSLILGGALGFNSSDSRLNLSQGELNSSGYSLSMYGTWFKGDSYYADGVLTLGRNSTDVTRRINYTIPGLSGGSTVIDQIATGSPDSDQMSFALSVGRDFNRGAWSFGPYLRGTYTKLDFDAYVERMSNPNAPGAGLALAVDERQLTSMQAVLGGKLSYAKSMSWGILMPSLQVEYVRELKDDPDGLVTRFAFDPTNSLIVIDGDPVDTDFINVGLGLSGVFANGRSGYVYYEHVAGKDRISQDSIAIGVRIEF